MGLIRNREVGKRKAMGPHSISIRTMAMPVSDGTLWAKGDPEATMANDEENIELGLGNVWGKYLISF